MQIKKCQWISRPEKVKIFSSSSLCFESKTKHALLYTFEEEGELTLEWVADKAVDISAIFINSINEGIKFQFKDESITKTLTISTLKTVDYLPLKPNKVMKIIKKGTKLFFYANELLLSEYERENVGSSVSLGLLSEGEGKVTFSFRFCPILG